MNNRIRETKIKTGFVKAYKPFIADNPQAQDRRKQLSQADRAEIKNNPDGLSRAELAKKYGVSYTTIRLTQNPQARKKHLKRQRDNYKKGKTTPSKYAPLTPEKIRKIKELKKQGFKLVEIEKMLNTTKNTICKYSKGIKRKPDPENLTDYDRAEILNFLKIGIAPHTICTRYQITPRQLNEIKPPVNNKPHGNSYK